MTHNSDYSFVQRGIANLWFYGWFVIYVFNYDRFSALSLKRLMRFELRSVVTFCMLVAMPLKISYDIGSTIVKYQEGFWVNPATGEIMGKPSVLWSPQHQTFVLALDYVLASGMAILASVFFLLQSFYHYISKTVTKTSFMSSLEFRTNTVISCLVIVLFPLLQYLFRNDHQYREAAPQMGFSCVLMLIAVLGVRTHFRFKRLLRVALLTVSEHSVGVIQKLEYFKDMNFILTLSMFMAGISLGIASADGLTKNPIIARNKFASDVLICNLNFFDVLISITLVLIFYPRRSIVGNNFGNSSGGTTTSRTANISSRHIPADSVSRQHDLSKNSSKPHQLQLRSDNRDSIERPSSIVIPYKAPDSLQRVQSHQLQNDSYNDTHPLTHDLRRQDSMDTAVQMEMYKSMYDPLHHSNSTSVTSSPVMARQPSYMQQQQLQQYDQYQQHSTGASRQSLTNNPTRSMSPRPQSPISPTARQNAPSSPFALDPLQQQQHQRASGPTFGTAVARPPATTKVGQHTFVLEEASSPKQQRSTVQQQGGGYVDDYGQQRSSASTQPTATATRPRKEPRALPQY
ncbi:hypothetical protein BGZ99_007822 [Dissophora globulifera]|uniref:Uncharacterized protein n=1 Tax=Dissophora globulifera TaxID=979702 RepID=A0A9P6RW47_9FUNG|nr:hypothetical protein BGZ99_007822 [Dissophora globulifera]